MSKHRAYQPTHAAPRPPVVGAAARKRLRTTALASGAASVVATGVSVSGGMLAGSASGFGVQTDLVAASADRTTPTLPSRAPVVSRADRRAAVDPMKAALLSSDQGLTTRREENLDDSDPRDIAKVLLGEFGFGVDQFGCLDSIWSQESGWRVDADNPSSSAYGIPQALTTTHAMPEGYMTSAEVQIRWGLEYIANRYGTPCNAWGFKQGHGWY